MNQHVRVTPVWGKRCSGERDHPHEGRARLLRRLPYKRMAWSFDQLCRLQECVTGFPGQAAFDRLVEAVRGTETRIVEPRTQR